MFSNLFNTLLTINNGILQDNSLYCHSMVLVRTDILVSNGRKIGIEIYKRIFKKHNVTITHHYILWL